MVAYGQKTSSSEKCVVNDDFPTSHRLVCKEGLGTAKEGLWHCKDRLDKNKVGHQGD